MTHAAAYCINGEQTSREAFYAVACNPKQSVAVEACAGAGKTWMLVSRILRALLDGAEPQDILAITFTRKAAGEMRARLHQWLQDFSQQPLQALVPELVLRGMNREQAQAQAAALQGLRQRLATVARPVQVRTFHGWFASLLGSAPLALLQELGLPAVYELLEDDAQAVSKAWPRFYAAVAAEHDALQDFMDSVAQHGRHQTLKALAHALSKRVEFALADAAGVVDASVQPADKLFPGWFGTDQEPAEPFDCLINRPDCVTALQAAAQALGRASAPTFAAKGADLERALDERQVGDALRALLTNEQTPRKFSDKLVGLAHVRAAQDLALQALRAQSQHAAWAHHQRLSRLARLLLREYTALKFERGWIDMNDVEAAARRLLGDAELSGWLQQRLDARVRHLLIDEFQDTNPLQWQALYGWLAAYAGAGPGEAPTVFLVGDPKQSIYRFRRAEPQVFKAAQAFVVDGLGGALLSCDHTRRCATVPVQALNAVMLAAVADGQYVDYRSHTTESQTSGAVLALPQVPRTPATANADGGLNWRDSLTTPRVLPEDNQSALEASQAVDWLAQELDSGVLQPGDVMVLARKRERLGWVFEALRERGIACEQPEKVNLTQAPVVQDMLALLDALVSPQHDLSLAQALKSPLFGCSDADLVLLATRVQEAAAMGAVANPAQAAPSWWDTLQRCAEAPEPRFVDSAVRLRLYREWINTLPPHDALSTIYQHGDVLARFAQVAPSNQRSAVLAALRALLNQSLAQDGGRFLTPYRFVRALKAGGVRAPVAAQINAVRLLTVHGAKGLEAHTVLLLDADAQPPNPPNMGVLVDWPGEAQAPRRFVFVASEKSPPECALDLLETERQARALEELNALYVALTRAVERLVLSSSEPSRRGNTPTWYQRVVAHAQSTTPTAPAEPTQVLSRDSHFELPELPAYEGARVGVPTRSEHRLEDAEPAGTDTRVDTLLDEQARVGSALHRLLQWWPTPQEGFVWSAAHGAAVAREFGLPMEQAAQALATARLMVQGEAAWVWDAQQLSYWRNEVELRLHGRLLRLDRLVRRRDSGHWWVLDFKIAEHPERQPALRAQMALYAEAVRETAPGDRVRLAFITGSGRLVELQGAEASA